MKIQENPFVSEPFISLWFKHFGKGRTPRVFPQFPGLTFVRHPRLPFLINAGATQTKGVSHGEIPTGGNGIGNKVLLVYDVAEYFDVPVPDRSSGIKVRRVRQYPGFLVQTTGFRDVEEYLQKHISKNSRYKLKKYRRRLHEVFDIRYEMHGADISGKRLDALFDVFRKLLEKRFDGKQIVNNNLDEKEWAFYVASAREMMQSGTAGLFVVYSGEEPVAFTLNYFSGNVVFDAITTFDVAYEKFHLGTVSLMGLLNWCMQSNRSLDLSKGYFEYKNRWTNRKYYFEYRIYYSRSSVSGKLLAAGIAGFYRVKQWLRGQGWNERFHQLTYRLGKPRGYDSERPIPYLLKEPARPLDSEIQQEVVAGSPEWRKLRPPLFEFLYLNPGNITNTRIFKLGEPGVYLIKNPKAQARVEIQEAP
ncbi:GNAT family N-acetyltransferase [Robiginitalea biformata]|uniref:BioF2-like acetyltransferase domain-containing protein n=1 Tax=Robiginitalea biformata (strain ATCC BAA-864 / DSM 15991 / KCTC 12146 / HTCC2501) TaxID=313596 RepID=A4CKB3_ROBBH|nr:GNAT family N-acetyltransferase [Robiginitalea biformata]EAR15312.1 hypothetical protein RB2501_13329 [Robiginitalea biformata HTCC2501]